MSMPGFTAENSLYRTNGRFLTVGSKTRCVFGEGIRPQQWIDPFLADYYCQWIGGLLICGDPPFGGGGIGFGGGQDSDVVRVNKCKSSCMNPQYKWKRKIACSDYCDGKSTCITNCMTDYKTGKEACALFCV
jgi:hypothetical protein